MKPYDPTEYKETLTERGLFNPKNYVFVVVLFPLIFFLNYMIGHGIMGVLTKAVEMAGVPFTDYAFWKVIVYSTVALLWQAVFLFMYKTLPASLTASVLTWFILVFLMR